MHDSTLIVRRMRRFAVVMLCLMAGSALLLIADLELWPLLLLECLVLIAGPTLIALQGAYGDAKDSARTAKAGGTFLTDMWRITVNRQQAAEERAWKDQVRRRP